MPEFAKIHKPQLLTEHQNFANIGPAWRLILEAAVLSTQTPIPDHITQTTEKVELAHQIGDEEARRLHTTVLIRATAVAKPADRDRAFNALILLITFGHVKVPEIGDIDPIMDEELRLKILEFGGCLWASRMNNPGITLLLAYGLDLIPKHHLQVGIADLTLSSRVQDMIHTIN